MTHAQTEVAATDEPDVVEAMTPYIPWVLPLAGAVLIFLLALIAISVA